MAGIACTQHVVFTAGCASCRYVDTRYNRRRRHAIAAGTWLHRVPAEHIRHHVRQLQDQGMSINAIARAANVASRTLRGALRDNARHVQGHTAAAVLAVTYRPTLPAGMVDVTPTARRIRALAAIGYPLSHIAQRLDRQQQQVWHWAWEKNATISTRIASQVATLCAQLEGTPGPSTRARNAALRNGWAPPLAWIDDDGQDTIDDPDAQPVVPDVRPDDVDEVLVHRAVQGDRTAARRLNDAERVAVVAQLTRAGVGAAQIGQRLGIASRSVVRHRDRIRQTAANQAAA